MSIFVDSSALVKLYVDEPGSDVVRDIAGPLVVAQVARVEVPAALWRLQRMRRARLSTTTAAVGLFAADYASTTSSPARFAVVRLTDALLVDAAQLTAARGLRAYDAVQLASARAAAHADDRVRTFAAFDVHLREAAAVEGFVLAPPALDDRG